MIYRSIFLLIFVLLERLCLYHAYLIQCPHISQWNYNAESFQCSPTTRYLCFYNTLQQSYEEKCGIEEEKASKGSKYVLSPNPNRVDCSPEYYQPFIFTSFGNSQCVYKKSTCTEEGQVIATNGSTETDRTCRCDYTKHYVYVTPPNEICSCKPSEEDCSCYLRPCTGTNQIMISDYRCVPKDRKPLPEQIKCTEITTSSSAPSVGRVTTPVIITSYKDFSDTSISAKWVSVIILFFGVLFVVLGLAICVNVRPQVTNTGVVYREDLIVTENYGKSITVIEGERLEIKCEYTSKLQVKAITWQHRNLDGNVQPVNSMGDQTSSLTLPLVINNISSKHSGRYECILTNRIGLSNTTYDRYPKLCNILRYLTACRLEEMNCVDINVYSLPDEYKTISVNKGKDGTLQISEQNYTRVMWFKHGEKLTSIKPTDKLNDPKDKSNESIDKSNEPTDKSNEPTDKSNEPTDKSNEPTDKSNEQTDKSNEQTDKSNEQTDKSNEPTDKSTDKSNEPTDKYNELIDKNNEPTDKYNEPTDKCNDPTDKSNEPTVKYNVYTNSKPSLTIKAVDFTDVGIYVCVVVDGQGEVESKGFNLRVIPQEDIYNKVKEHRNDSDSEYIKTAGVDKAMKCLHQHGKVVLSGREGTGKSKLCLELASSCEKLDYLPYTVDLSKDSVEDFGPAKILCIIDCNKYDSQDTDKLQKLLTDILSREHVWLIFTCRSTDFINVQNILQESSLLKEGTVIDLNKSLTQEEKKQILKLNMTANNIAESSTEESNFHIKEILKNNKIQVKIDTKTIEKIIKTEPLHGFPQTVVKFCKDRQLLYLGKKYFSNLPESQEREIFRLAEIGSIELSALNGKMKYCVLAYIATNENKCLEIRDINTKRIVDLCQVLYTINLYQLSSNINLTDIDVNSMIKDAIKDLEGKFIIEEGGEYRFIHPYVLTTIYASHEHFTDHLIAKGSFCEIKELIRSSKYIYDKGEMVCKSSGVKRNINLCRRLLTDASKDRDSAKDVGMYIYEQFIKLEDTEFRDNLISLLESRIYSEKSPKDSVRQSVSEEQMDQSYEKEPKISFWEIVLLMDELTGHGKDSWVLLQKRDESADQPEEFWSFPLQIPDNVLLCGLITTCFNKIQDVTCKENLLKQFKSKLQHGPFLKTLMQRVDIHGNTFFHYLVILSEEESCFILEGVGKLLSGENRSIFGRSNKMDLAPLDMAAYLGKLKLFRLLLDKTEQSYIDKNQGHLRELTEEGRIFRYHDTKTTAKDKENNRMSLNFDEGLLKYIQYGKEKDFLDILDLHKKTKLKKKVVRKL